MFKFLSPDGCTYYENKPFEYNLPRRDEKWAVTEHPSSANYDGKACGPGRLHLMKYLNVRYAPSSWWPWWAKPSGELIGQDEEKAAYAAVALRRIKRNTFWRTLRPPFNWGRRADLHGANLSGANLSGADLSGADLCGADLRGADLCRANLSGANLYRSNLSEADLYKANLRGASLYRANLSGANLHGADLSGASLCRANLSGANLSGADLHGANLHGAKGDSVTTWPAEFDVNRLNP